MIEILGSLVLLVVGLLCWMIIIILAGTALGSVLAVIGTIVIVAFLPLALLVCLAMALLMGPVLRMLPKRIADLILRAHDWLFDWFYLRDGLTWAIVTVIVVLLFIGGMVCCSKILGAEKELRAEHKKFYGHELVVSPGTRFDMMEQECETCKNKEKARLLRHGHPPGERQP